MSFCNGQRRWVAVGQYRAQGSCLKPHLKRLNANRARSPGIYGAHVARTSTASSKAVKIPNRSQLPFRCRMTLICRLTRGWQWEDPECLLLPSNFRNRSILYNEIDGQHSCAERGRQCAGAASGVEAWNSQKVTIGNARFDHCPRVNVALSTGKIYGRILPLNVEVMGKFGSRDHNGRNWNLSCHKGCGHIIHL